MKLHFVFALAAAALVTGCMSQADTSAVEASVARFHEQQARSDDQAIYDSASPGFRANARLEDLARLNTAVRAVEGCNAPTRNPSVWNNNVSTSGHFITVVYNRTCTTGDLSETFVFVVNGADARLYGYNVSGMALFPPAPAAAPAAEPTAPADGAAAAPAPTEATPPSSEGSPT